MLVDSKVETSPLQPGSFSHKKIGRGRSKEKKHRVKEVDWSRIDSDNADDIFDLNERYQPAGSISVGERVDDSAQRSHSPSIQKAIVETRDEGGEMLSHTKEDAPRRKTLTKFDPEEYIFKFVEQLQIKEVLEGLQSGSMNVLAQEQEANAQERDQKHDASSTKRLQDQLETEIRCSARLQTELRELARKHQAETEEQNQRILALEEKLLEARGAAISKEFALPHKEGFNEEDGESFLIQTLKEEVSELQSKVSELIETRSKLEADLESKDSEGQRNMTSKSIRDFELVSAQKEQQCAAERAKCKHLELELEKARGLLELEKKKSRALELSEKRAQMLLESERQRCETLGNLNDRLQVAMKKLSNKVKEKQAAKSKTSSLRKELELRDSRIDLIQQILNEKVTTNSRTTSRAALQKYTMSTEEAC